MKFNSSLNIEFSQWSQASMVREDNRKIVNSTRPKDNYPEYGEGSVYGRAAKEEARLKKRGINKTEYDPEAQPWLMKVGGKKGKKYKGIKQGGVSDNTTFYVFIECQDGSLEAYPVKDWYNFTPIMTYNTLDAEEADEKFSQNRKILNKWSVMVHKKLKPAQDDAESDRQAAKKGLKVSDMDDWEGSGLDTDDEEKNKNDDSDDEGKRNKKGKDTKKKQQKHYEEKNEAFDDSEDDDRQDREVDYMSDESSAGESSEEENANAKGVDMDGSLSKMLGSDESSDDEDKDDDKGKKKKAYDENETGKNNKVSGEIRANSDEGDVGKGKKGSANISIGETHTRDLKKTDKGEKRKLMETNILNPNDQPSKKSRLKRFVSAGQSGRRV